MLLKLQTVRARQRLASFIAGVGARLCVLLASSAQGWAKMCSTRKTRLVHEDMHAVRLPMSVSRCRVHGKTLAFLLLLYGVLVTPVFAATAPGTVVTNTADFQFNLGTSTINLTSNAANITVTGIPPTVSSMRFLQYAPNNSSSVSLRVGPTSFDSGGGIFVPSANPVVVPNTTLDPTNPVPLTGATVSHSGDPIFIEVTDGDQNTNSTVRNTIQVTISVNDTGDTETIQLTETGPNTGIFVGYVQTTRSSSATNDGLLEVNVSSGITATYQDVSNSTDVSTSTVLVDPLGVVFDSATGALLDGVVLTLINADTGNPAQVFGDDGTSAYPSTVITGGQVMDASGVVYNFSQGMYRFPFVPPGNYQLQVLPPSGFTAPSTVSIANLQALPNAPFILFNASFGASFPVNPGPAVQVDIPVDAVATELFVTKSASTDQVAVGDFLQYQIDIINLSDQFDARDVTVVDDLPFGFRYQAGSARVGGASITDPVISGDGQTLTFSIGDVPADGTVNLRYVVEVAAGSQPGPATNQALAQAQGGDPSNIATATVEVGEDLIRSHNVLVGRISLGQCGTDDSQGVGNIRLYMENGSYVVTDENGRYHFEGVRPGTHVLQLDLATIPEDMEIVDCVKNTRAAGSAFSRFIELQGGTLWREDWRLRRKTPESGEAGLRMQGEALEDGRVRFTVSYSGSKVAINNVRISVLLPEGSVYEVNSSAINDNSVADPSITADLVLTYRLGNQGKAFENTLGFVADLSGIMEEPIVRAISMFDTVAETSLRTPVAITSLSSSGDSEWQMVDVAGVQETAGMVSVMDQLREKLNIAVPPQVNPALIANATPQAEILWPTDATSPVEPAVPVIVKHAPNELVQVYVNGVPVNPANFIGTIKNDMKTVAVSSWSGVFLNTGPNKMEVVITDRNGREKQRLIQNVHYSEGPVRAEIIEELSHLVADGKTMPVIAVKFYDRWDEPLRTDMVGRFQVQEPYRVYEDQRELAERKLLAINPRQPNYRIEYDGIAFIELAPTTQSGEVVLNFEFGERRAHDLRTWLKAEARDWILVGLATGSVNNADISGNMQGLNAADLEDGFSSDGRIAFFAKGRIKGEYLLTVAYDTDKEDRRGEDGLFQIIDPDRFYTLYGDGTEQRYDAASAEKLYLKIEKDKFFALYGDFDTGLDYTELAQYSRRLNGVKSELRTENFSYTVFGSETTQGFVKDEIQGDGTSGLYRLSRQRIIPNTETIVLETRDRFRGDVVISTQSLTRHVDYNINYFDGTLFFKAPIRSRDSSFNPIFIVADYEVLDGAADNLTAGGRAAVHLANNKVELGSTYVSEELSNAEGDLTGVDARWQINNGTEIRAEFAQTETTDTATGTTTEADAFLAELKHSSERVDGRVYMRDQDAGFGLGQQNASQGGLRTMGGDVKFRVNDNINLVAETFMQENKVQSNDRLVAEGAIEYHDDKTRGIAGLRQVNDDLGVDGKLDSQQAFVGGSYDLNSIVTARIGADIELTGDSESFDYPERQLLGLDFKVSDKALVFIQKEYAKGPNVETELTSVGVRAQPWDLSSINTSVSEQVTENGARTFANLGLTQGWQVNEHLLLDVSYDKVKTLDGPAPPRFDDEFPSASGTPLNNDDFTAYSFGATYHKDDWTLTNRIELFESSDEDRIGLFSGFLADRGEGIAASMSLQLFDSDFTNGDKEFFANARFGFAYRPDNTRWIFLDRLDLVYEERKSVSLDQQTWKLVNNFNANFLATERDQLAIQYGSKWVQANFDGNEFDGYTDLTGFEYRHDFNEYWDFGLQTSVLHTWNNNAWDQSYGVSVGRSFAKNIWISVGYNWTGFRDQDFHFAKYTSQGAYLQFRIKFDQNSFKEYHRSWSGVDKKPVSDSTKGVTR